MRKITEATDTLLEMSNFFHAVAHEKNLTISKGVTVRELARKASTQAPQSLRGAVIRSTSTRPLKLRRDQRAMTVTYEHPPGEPDVVEFKGCVDVGTTSGPITGTVKVCIDCSITKLRCTITIVATGTIVIG